MQQNKLLLVVVVINYRTPHLTIQCLESLVPQLTEGQKVVVVDNNSADDSLCIIEKWISDRGQSSVVDLIASSENIGFSGGNNIGLRNYKAEHYLLLNSDTILREKAIEKLLLSAAEHPKAGMISPRLEWEDGEAQISCFNFHSPISEFLKASSTNFLSKILSKWVTAITVTDEKTWPQWTSFACILLKSEMISDIGLMDEGYFLYYEDVDYCKLAYNAGWKVLNDPSAHVVHLRGGSSDVKKNTALNKRIPKYVYHSRTRYFRKHYGVFGVLLANILWCTGWFISVIKRVLRIGEARLPENHYIDIWTNFFAQLKPYRTRD